MNHNEYNSDDSIIDKACEEKIKTIIINGIEVPLDLLAVKYGVPVSVVNSMIEDVVGHIIDECNKKSVWCWICSKLKLCN